MAPSKVIIIRHGEKPQNKEECCLSELGEKRALFLVDYFLSNKHLYGEISAIFAARPCHDGSSTRSADTVRHLATCLNPVVNVNLNYCREPKKNVGLVNKFGLPKKSEQTDMADEILNNPLYNNKSVLICWEHHTIPDLILSLRGPNIGEWGNDYSRVLVLEYTENGVFKHEYLQPPLV